MRLAREGGQRPILNEVTRPHVRGDGTRDLSASRSTRVIVLATEHAAFEQVEGHGVEISRGRRSKVLVFATFADFVRQIRRGVLP